MQLQEQDCFQGCFGKGKRKERKEGITLVLLKFSIKAFEKSKAFFVPARAGSFSPILYDTAVLGLHRQRAQTAMPVQSKTLQLQPWMLQSSNQAIEPRKILRKNK